MPFASDFGCAAVNLCFADGFPRASTPDCRPTSFVLIWGYRGRVSTRCHPPWFQISGLTYCPSAPYPIIFPTSYLKNLEEVSPL